MIGKRHLVEVTWDDAHSTDAWTDVEALDRKAQRCTTVGYLLSAGEVWVIAGTVSEDAQACCVMHIPVGCVVRSRRLS